MALARLSVDQKRVHRWINKYCEKYDLTLSDEQQNSVSQVLERRLSILTGGPGCGKTTTTKVIVALLKAMGKQVMLAAPTGRAAQRMSEVIGMEARTIHRLLEWDPLRGGFKRNEDSPLACDFLIVDESSMLDVHLAASLFKAVPDHAQLLLIGDADQLPSVGAGYVFGDMIDSGIVKCARLTQVFRQASQSAIIQHAHSINEGIMPIIPTPFQNPQLWQSGIDCLFIDAEEATQEQLRFIRRVKNYASYLEETEEENVAMAAEESQEYRARPKEFHIPEKFLHVDIAKVLEAPSYTEELKEVMRRVSRWSALHWGLTASDMVIRLYQDIIPRYINIPKTTK